MRTAYSWQALGVDMELGAWRSSFMSAASESLPGGLPTAKKLLNQDPRQHHRRLTPKQRTVLYHLPSPGS